MRIFLSALVVVMSATGAVAFGANLYRWVDKDGHVHYTDQPPPAAARNIQEKNLGGNYIEGDALPYATREAAKKYPVVVYLSNCGDPCTKARDYLRQRGIPYTAKNPEQPGDAEALKKLIGALEVPVMVVGNAAPVKGFDPGTWGAALDAAGYPKSGTPAK